MLALMGIIVVIIITLSGFLYHRHRKLKACYEIIWKKSSSLKQYDVLGLRGEPKLGFNEYYYIRKDEDKLIKKRIEKGENILIKGNPLAGKTRAIYHALINLDKKHKVIIPRIVDINPTDFLIPLRSRFGSKSILVLDDLDKFIEKQHFMYLLQEYLNRSTIIIASCRSGPEYDKLCEKLEIKLSSIFDDPIEMPKISIEEGEKVAEETGKRLPPEFDGNIGSIFLPLETMRDRFRDCIEVNKCILMAIKRLYYAGIYREREIFSIERVKRVCQEKEIEMESYKWNEMLNDLENNGFIEIMKKGEVWAEETYLMYVIEDAFSPLDNLDEMITIFSNDAEALINIGNRACDIGIIVIKKAEYMKTAIKSYEKALKVYTLEDSSMDYAMTQNNLGTAYVMLAEVEDKAENCNSAIGAFKEALKVRTLERLPTQYATTQNNLGNAYRTLAEVEDKAENCKKATKAFKEALRVFTFERFPMNYAGTQNNLGAAYRTLAEVEDKAENCKKAIISLKEALKVYTFEDLPMDYAMTHNNLGAAYSTLAEVEDKAENCKKAIISLKEALKVHTIENFPMDYAMTQNNLGNAYRTLAEVEDKAENCKRAIEFFNEALKVRTPDRFPMQYAGTHNDLGYAYSTLAEVEDKAENCKKAIKAFKEALKIRTLERLPIDYTTTQNNIGYTYITLAKVDDKAENSKRAIKAYKESLKVRTLERFPMDFAMTKNNLGVAYQTLAEVDNKAKNCSNAKEAFKEALKVFTKEDLPQLHNLVQVNIRILIAFCEGE